MQKLHDGSKNRTPVTFSNKINIICPTTIFSLNKCIAEAQNALGK